MQKEILSSSDTRQSTVSNNPNASSQTQGQNSSTAQNTSTADYRAISRTNNVLSVNNIQPEYANTVASAVQQVEPTVSTANESTNGTTDSSSRTTNDFNYGRWNDGRFYKYFASISFHWVIIGLD